MQNSNFWFSTFHFPCCWWYTRIVHCYKWEKHKRRVSSLRLYIKRLRKYFGCWPTSLVNCPITFPFHTCTSPWTCFVLNLCLDYIQWPWTLPLLYLTFLISAFLPSGEFGLYNKTFLLNQHNIQLVVSTVPGSDRNRRFRFGTVWYREPIWTKKKPAGSVWTGPFKSSSESIMFLEKLLWIFRAIHQSSIDFVAPTKFPKWNFHLVSTKKFTKIKF